MGTETRLLASSLQQPVLCYLCLKDCLSPTCSQAGCFSLGMENINVSGFSPGECPLDLWSFLLSSSPLPKWLAFSWRAVLQTEHGTPAEHSPTWRLLPAGCTPICIPILCFSFFPFCHATTQHCQFTFNWRSTVTPILSWRAAVSPAVPQPVLVSRATSIQLSEPSGATCYRCQPLCSWWAKCTLAMLPHKMHRVVYSS